MASLNTFSVTSPSIISTFRETITQTKSGHSVHMNTSTLCSSDTSRLSVRQSDSQSVSYFTVPPRAHPSTGSQSGSASPDLTQVPSTPPGGYSSAASVVRAVSESLPVQKHRGEPAVHRYRYKRSRFAFWSRIRPGNPAFSSSIPRCGTGGLRYRATARRR